MAFASPPGTTQYRRTLQQEPIRSTSLGGPGGAHDSPTQTPGSSSTHRHGGRASYGGIVSSPPADLATRRENIFVCVRFRPLTNKEHNRREKECWAPLDDRHVRAMVAQDSKGSSGGAGRLLGLGNRASRSNDGVNSSSLQNKDGSPVTYAYDYVFHGMTRTRDVYRAAARPAVRGAMEGTDGTVFAYGVTSSGKTHTMSGCDGDPGVIPLAVEEVFRIIDDTPAREYVLRVSYFEIYNEVINDLLDPANTHLRVREEAGRGVYVEGLKEEVVLSGDHVMSLIAAGEAHRHVGSTRFNEESSRSHTIFRLWCESSATRTGSPKTNGRSSPTAPMHGDQGDSAEGAASLLGTLNLIDLAGSESSRAANSGKRQTEGAYINKSLLTLGTVIAKLSDKKDPGHVPYRDSKLTRVLQPALSGKGKVSLICTVTPASGNVEETHNTLKFAHRAKSIQVSTHLNEVLDEKSLIKKYRAEIRDLRKQLEQVQFMKGQGGGDGPLLDSMEDVNALRQRVAEEHAALLEREADKLALEARIQRLTKIILHSSRLVEPIDARTTRPSPGGVSIDQPIKRSRSFDGELPDLASLSVGNENSGGGGGGSMSRGAGGVTPDTRKEHSQEVERRKGGFMSWLRGKGFSGTPESRAATPASRRTPYTSEKQPMSARANKGQADSPPSAFSKKANESPNLVGHVARGNTGAGDIHLGAAAMRTDSERELDQAQIEMFRQEMRILAREIAEKDDALAEASHSTAASQEEIRVLRQQILEKNRRMSVLEQREIGATEHQVEPSQFASVVDRLRVELGERNFEVQVTQADNRVLQERVAELTSGTEQMREENEELHRRLQAAARRSADAGSPRISEPGSPVTVELSAGSPVRFADPSSPGDDDWADANDTIVVEHSGLAMEANKALQRELDYARGFSLEDLDSRKVMELEAQAMEALRRISEVRMRSQDGAEAVAPAPASSSSPESSSTNQSKQPASHLGWPFGKRSP